MDRVAPYLLLGTVEEAVDRGSLRRHGVDAVLRVGAAPARPYPEFVRVQAAPLVEGRDNEYADFRDAADALAGLLEDGYTTLVHCTAGRSRSAAVVAAVLAVQRDTDVGTALGRIEVKRGVEPHPYLVEQAEQYVEEKRRRDGRDGPS